MKRTSKPYHSDPGDLTVVKADGHDPNNIDIHLWNSASFPEEESDVVARANAAGIFCVAAVEGPVSDGIPMVLVIAREGVGWHVAEWFVRTP